MLMVHSGLTLGPDSMTDLWYRHRVNIKIVTDLLFYLTTIMIENIIIVQHFIYLSLLPPAAVGKKEKKMMATNRGGRGKIKKKWVATAGGSRGKTDGWEKRKKEATELFFLLFFSSSTTILKRQHRTTTRNHLICDSFCMTFLENVIDMLMVHSGLTLGPDSMTDP